MGKTALCRGWLVVLLGPEFGERSNYGTVWKSLESTRQLVAVKKMHVKYLGGCDTRVQAERHLDRLAALIMDAYLYVVSAVQ